MAGFGQVGGGGNWAMMNPSAPPTGVTGGGGFAPAMPSMGSFPVGGASQFQPQAAGGIQQAPTGFAIMPSSVRFAPVL